MRLESTNIRFVALHLHTLCHPNKKRELSFQHINCTQQVEQTISNLGALTKLEYGTCPWFSLSTIWTPGVHRVFHVAFAQHNVNYLFLHNVLTCAGR